MSVVVLKLTLDADPSQCHFVIDKASISIKMIKFQGYGMYCSYSVRAGGMHGSIYVGKDALTFTLKGMRRNFPRVFQFYYNLPPFSSLQFLMKNPTKLEFKIENMNIVDPKTKGRVSITYSFSNAELVFKKLLEIQQSIKNQNQQVLLPVPASFSSSSSSSNVQAEVLVITPNSNPSNPPPPTYIVQPTPISNALPSPTIVLPPPSSSQYVPPQPVVSSLNVGQNTPLIQQGQQQVPMNY